MRKRSGEGLEGMVYLPNQIDRSRHTDQREIEYDCDNQASEKSEVFIFGLIIHALSIPFNRAISSCHARRDSRVGGYCEGQLRLTPFCFKYTGLTAMSRFRINAAVTCAHV